RAAFDGGAAIRDEAIRLEHARPSRAPRPTGAVLPPPPPKPRDERARPFPRAFRGNRGPPTSAGARPGLRRAPAPPPDGGTPEGAVREAGSRVSARSPVR